MEVQEVSQTRIPTLWERAQSYPSFRAFLRAVRVAAAAGIGSFLATLIPQLQAEPSIGGTPIIALALLFLDKYLRDKRVY